MNPTQIIKVAHPGIPCTSGQPGVRVHDDPDSSADGPLRLRDAIDRGERLRELEQPRITVTDVVTVANIADAPREELNAEVHDDAIDGYLLVERDDDELLDTRYVSTETTNVNLVRVLRNAVRSGRRHRPAGRFGHQSR